MKKNDFLDTNDDKKLNDTKMKFKFRLIELILILYEKKLFPVIFFSFSKKECENCFYLLNHDTKKRNDFNTYEEKEKIKKIYENYQRYPKTSKKLLKLILNFYI